MIISVFLVFYAPLLTASSVSYKENRAHHATNKSVFWNVVHLLKDNNDLDIQSILLISDQPHCQCDSTLSGSIARDITDNNQFIPYVCISQYHSKYNHNDTDLFGIILKDEKPSIVIMWGTEKSMLEKLSQATSTQTSKHIWLIVHEVKQLRINTQRKLEVNIPDASKIKQLRFDSRVFFWKGDLSKSIIWEIYRMCTDGSVVTHPLMVIKNGYVPESNSNYIWERRRNLRGCEIKVAYINRPPYMYEKKSSRNTTKIETSRSCFNGGNKTMCGNYAPLLKLTAEQLNFTVVWVQATDGAFGHLDPITLKWNGLLGLLDDNEADLSPCWHFITFSKALYFDFSHPITRYGAHLYMKKPHMAASWGTYYHVFHKTYWVVMIGFCTVISLLFCGIYVFYHITRPCSNDNANLIGYVFSYLISGIATVCLSLGCNDVSISVPRHFRVNNSLRIIFLVTTVFGMLNYFIYTSKLVSMLAIEKYELPINKLEDFLTKTDYQLTIMTKDGVESYFSDAEDKVRKTIWETQIQDNPDAYVSSAAQGDKIMMENHRRVLLLTQDSATGLQNYPCALSRTTREFSRQFAGYAFVKHSVYVGLFSHILNDIIEFGNVQYVKTLIEMESSSSNCNHREEYRSLGYENIFSLFFIFVAGMVISCVYAFIEIIYQKYSM